MTNPDSQKKQREHEGPPREEAKIRNQRFIEMFQKDLKTIAEDLSNGGEKIFRCLIHPNPFGDNHPIIILPPVGDTQVEEENRAARAYLHDLIFENWAKKARSPLDTRAGMFNGLEAQDHHSFLKSFIEIRKRHDDSLEYMVKFDRMKIESKLGKEILANLVKVLHEDYKVADFQDATGNLNIEKLIREDMFAPMIKRNSQNLRANGVTEKQIIRYENLAQQFYIINGPRETYQDPREYDLLFNKIKTIESLTQRAVK